MKFFVALLSILSFTLVQAVPAPATSQAADNSTVEDVNSKFRLQARQGGPSATVFSRCTVGNRVALTFDDGPYWNTQRVADLLTNAGAKGTFFVNGNNWACIYNTEISRQLKYAYDRGHQIASHTWAHNDLTTLTWDQIHHQMWLTEQAVTRITGAVPAFMRPPYGNYNSLVLQASYIRGQSIVTWDLDSGDSVGVSVAGQRARFDDFVNRHPSTGLILQHEVQQSTVDNVLPYALGKLKAAGYQLVTVAECLGRAPYQRVGSPGVRDPSWTC